MAASIAKICDPRCHKLGDAVREAKAAASVSTRFEANLIRYLQIQSVEPEKNCASILQGLEVLGHVAEERRLSTLLQPFLRSGVPRIASKAVLVAGKHCSDFTWLVLEVKETDDRTRANLIESLWKRDGPGLGELFEGAMYDRHHRVAANAVYGLYLRGSELYRKGLERLSCSKNPLFRRSAIWVIRSAGSNDAVANIKPFIVDPDPGVRHAAFEALVRLRAQPAAMPAEIPEPVISLQAE